MGEKNRIDPSIPEGMRKLFGANTQSSEDAILAQEELETERSEVEEAEVKRVQRQALLDLLFSSYGVLSQALYQVLYDTIVWGKTDKQIAEGHGISLGAVRTRKCRGKKEFRALMLGDGKPPSSKQSKKRRKR